jgi:hypothetical protein
MKAARTLSLAPCAPAWVCIAAAAAAPKKKWRRLIRLMGSSLPDTILLCQSLLNGNTLPFRGSQTPF